MDDCCSQPGEYGEIPTSAIAPIGFDEGVLAGSAMESTMTRRAVAHAERQKADNYLAQLRIEADALRLCADTGFVASLQRDYATCPDLRAKATFGKCLAEIARLGKREPANSAATGPQQITINVIHAAPVSREQVLEEFGIVGEPPSQTIDIEPEAKGKYG